MSTTFILIIIVTLVITYLIFKFIKKLVFAILATVLLFGLIFGGILGLAYLDFKQLSEKQDFDVHIFYGLPEDLEFGLTIPVKNQEIDINSVQSYDISTFTEEILEDKKTDDFYVFVSKEFYDEKILIEDASFSLLGSEELVLGSEGVEVDATLNAKEVRVILESNSPTEEFVRVLIDNNPEFGLLTEFGLEDVVIGEIDRQLEERNIDAKEAIFISTFASAMEEDESVAIDILRGYQDDEIIVHPGRLTFSLVKAAPLGLVDNILGIGSDEKNESSS